MIVKRGVVSSRYFLLFGFMAFLLVILLGFVGLKGGINGFAVLDDNSGSSSSIVVLQNGLNYGGCDDAYIYGWDPYYLDSNFGQEERLIMWNYPNYSRKFAIKFKIYESEGGLVPDDAVIKKATLSLYPHSFNSGRGSELDIYEIVKDWDESNVTWRLIGEYFQGVPSLSKIISPGFVWNDFDLTESVMGFNRERNYGWMIEHPGSQTRWMAWKSSEADQEFRPKLTIEYSLEGAGNYTIPEETNNSIPEQNYSCVNDSNCSINESVVNQTLGNYSDINKSVINESVNESDSGEIVIDEIELICELKRAYWDKQDANEGEYVSLVVESENCDGKAARFEIYETDGWFGKEEIRELDGKIIENRSEVVWEAEIVEDNFLGIIPTSPEYVFKVSVNPEIMSENLLSVSEVASPGEFSALDSEESSFDSSGWYSWAKDSHNSRIADDVIVPPFTLKWTARYPGSDTNPSLLLTRILYQNDRTFLTMAIHGARNEGAGIAAYNATNGESFWNAGRYGALGSIGLDVLGYGFVWGGSDHRGNYQLDIETGKSFHGGVMDSYANADESGVYGYGVPCIDCTSIALRAWEIFFEATSEYDSGKFNQALRFREGANSNVFPTGDYLTINDSAEVDIGNSDVSIMFWFKPNTTDDIQYLFSKGHDNVRYAVQLRYGGVYYALETLYSGSYKGSGNFTCNANEWCHFALTYDHNKERLYKNGVLVFESENTKDVPQNDEPLYIGGNRDYNSFDGLIDEFVMYDRALDDLEISQIYNSEINAGSDDLELLLKFNNEAGLGESESFIYDYSGNENNAYYDGHLNKAIKWSNIRGGTYSGIPYSWYGGDAGLGQPAITDGILYLPDGILWAYNVTNGDVIWRSGEWPKLAIDGNITYFSEVTYSNGNVYVFGRVKNSSILNIPEPWNPKGSTAWMNGWEKPCLFVFDVLTGVENNRICLPNDYAPLDYYLRSPLVFPGRGFQTIVEGNKVYISTVAQILAYDLDTNEKIWEYNRTVKIKYQRYDKDIYDLYDYSASLFDVGDIAISGNLIYGLEHFEDSIIALDKDTGQKTWMFRTPDGDRLTGLAIASNMLFVSGFSGILYSFEQGYSGPEIINNDSVLPTGGVGSPYIERYIIRELGYTRNYTFKVNDGEWPFSWSVSLGRLPNGLSIKQNEDNFSLEIFGTPIESGDFNFTVEVEDARGNSDEKEFVIRIVPESLEFTKIIQEGVDGYDGCEDAGMDG
ncbi:MAG: LamG-like jellyroll fold domain-containing protein, partial [Nanoarchaeota archaeon]